MACVADIDEVLAEKRIERVTLRISDTLKDLGEEVASRYGTSLGDYTNTVLARDIAAQGLLGSTRSDIAELEITLLRGLAIARSMKLAGAHRRAS